VFTIDGRHEQAAGITDLATDLWCYRGVQLLHRGRIGTSGDELDADTHTSTFNAPDYRALLDRRILYDSDKLSYVAEDQSSIAWQLIQATQGKSGGNLGITRGTGQTTGYMRTRTYQAGKSIAESITQLGDAATGFDWEIDPNLALNVYNPERGRDTDVVLDYGGLASKVSRTLNPGEYANAVRATAAADPRAPEYRTAADILTRPEGRFELDQGFPDVLEQATLSTLADGLLADSQTLRPAYTLTLRQDGYPGPDELWLGDTAIVRIKSGRLNVAEAMRVMELTFEPGSDGEEVVRVTVGHPNPAGQFAARLRATDTRLSLLERR
jgi:hypothetical protein